MKLALNWMKIWRNIQNCINLYCKLHKTKQVETCKYKVHEKMNYQDVLLSKISQFSSTLPPGGQILKHNSPSTPMSKALKVHYVLKCFNFQVQWYLVVKFRNAWFSCTLIIAVFTWFSCTLIIAVQMYESILHTASPEFYVPW